MTFLIIIETVPIYTLYIYRDGLDFNNNPDRPYIYIYRGGLDYY